MPVLVLRIHRLFSLTTKFVDSVRLTSLIVSILRVPQPRNSSKRLHPSGIKILYQSMAPSEHAPVVMG